MATRRRSWFLRGQRSIDRRDDRLPTLMSTSGHKHSHHDHHGSGPDSARAAPSQGTTVDPVCGMTVDIASTQHKHSLGGRTWYFCSKSCRDTFAAEPERYAAARP